jgi:type 1 fimbria pilin
MTISDQTNERNKFKESTGVLGQPGEVVVNPDGSNIGSGEVEPENTALIEYTKHITANETNTPTASTAYISQITITIPSGGTSSTIVIQDKSGTPLKLVDGLATVAINTTPTVLNFQTPIKMTGGFDIITAGVGAATVDIWINYYQ